MRRKSRSVFFTFFGHVVSTEYCVCLFYVYVVCVNGCACLWYDNRIVVLSMNRLCVCECCVCFVDFLLLFMLSKTLCVWMRVFTAYVLLALMLNLCIHCMVLRAPMRFFFCFRIKWKRVDMKPLDVRLLEISNDHKLLPKWCWCVNICGAHIRFLLSSLTAKIELFRVAWISCTIRTYLLENTHDFRWLIHFHGWVCNVCCTRVEEINLLSCLLAC